MNDGIPATTLRAAYAHADACYPDECCGLILADGSYRAGTNIQGVLHAGNPDSYPRTAREAYTLSPRDLAILHGRGSAKPLAIVHSHPDAAAYFSAEDERKALYLGIPVYDVDYLVIETPAGGSCSARLYRFDGTRYACVAVHGGGGEVLSPCPPRPVEKQENSHA